MEPTPVTAIDAAPAAVTDRLPVGRVGLDSALVGRLADVCDSVTADDVVFSLALAASPYADGQISGTLNGIGVTAKALDAHTVQFDFAKGSPTFDIEISTMVFPLYVTSKAYHSNGEISAEAFDKFRN